MAQLGNSRAKRMEKYLEKIGNSLGLTDAGRKWLIMALDPFNDSLDNHLGFPDGAGVKNLVEQVKLTETINNPTSNTANWDCLIIQLPWELPAKMYTASGQATASSSLPNQPSNLLNQYAYQSSGSSFNLGGIMIVCMPSSNNNWNPQTGNWSAFVSANTGSVTCVTPDASYLADNYRVANKGFEVANTTSTLNRQGTVTLFKTPTPPADAASTGVTYNYTTGNVSTAYLFARVQSIDMWPGTSQTAFLATDSIQHNAEEGVYMPAIINELDDMTYYKYDPTQPFVIGTGGANAQSNLLMGLTASVAATPWTGSTYGVTGVEWSPFHMTGCLFQGLSTQTTLQLNAKWGIERFPSQNNSVLAPLAHSPPDRDPIALDLYSHIIQSMPVGCKFNDNGFGDWIADALGSAADFISPVLSAIPHPAAQALSMGLRASDAGMNPGRAGAAQARRISRMTGNYAQDEAAKKRLDNQKIVAGSKN